MITVKEWLESLRVRGKGLWDAMDLLDMAAAHNGYCGGAYYGILCDVYADWKEERKPKRKRQIPSKIMPEEWETILSRYDYQCFYCGSKDRKLTKDHVIPKSKGGEDIAANIVPACWPCNRRKWTRLVETFKEGATLKLI